MQEVEFPLACGTVPAQYVPPPPPLFFNKMDCLNESRFGLPMHPIVYSQVLCCAWCTVSGRSCFARLFGNVCRPLFGAPYGFQVGLRHGPALLVGIQGAQDGLNPWVWHVLMVWQRSCGGVVQQITQKRPQTLNSFLGSITHSPAIYLLSGRGLLKLISTLELRHTLPSQHTLHRSAISLIMGNAIHKQTART